MNTEQAILGILKHRENIHNKNMWHDPMQLSDSMTKLAVYNAYLADDMAGLHKSATDKAYKVYTEAKNAGETASYSEQLSRGESTDQRYNYENVQNIYKATGNLISVIQSRLKVIENQRRQEGIE